MTDTFENELFPDIVVEHIELDILSDFWQALNAEFNKNEWSFDEGLRYILALGLRVLKDESIGNNTVAEGIGMADQITHLQNERMFLESRYAVMKYRSYQFMQSAKVMEMKFNALKMQVDRLKKANQDLRIQLLNIE